MLSAVISTIYEKCNVNVNVTIEYILTTYCGLEIEVFGVAKLVMGSCSPLTSMLWVAILHVQQ